METRGIFWVNTDLQSTSWLVKPKRSLAKANFLPQLLSTLSRTKTFHCPHHSKGKKIRKQKIKSRFSCHICYWFHSACLEKTPHIWGLLNILGQSVSLCIWVFSRGTVYHDTTQAHRHVKNTNIEKEEPHRDITNGNGRYALPVGRQVGHMGEVVQVPQDASTVLGATHQEAEGNRCCQACDSLCVSI